MNETFVPVLGAISAECVRVVVLRSVRLRQLVTVRGEDDGVSGGVSGEGEE